MAVGRSRDTDSRAAGREATLAALQGPDARLLLVFAAISHDPAQLAAGIAEAAPGVPVIGCSTHGEIAPGGPADGSVVVTALGGAGFAVSTAAVPEVEGRQRDAGAELAACAHAVEDRPHKVLLLLTDGLTRDQESVLRGAYDVVGATVPLFGGAAGDGWRMSGTFQIHGEQVLTSGAVAACLASDAPLGIGVSHGWEPVGEPLIVTRSAGGRVLELDDEPALDAYLRRLDAPAGVCEDPQALSRFLLSRPLGVRRRSGIAARNMSTEVDVEGRTIGGGGDLALGGLAWPMTGDVESILASTAAACRQAVEPLGGRAPVGMLTFSCAACRAVLDDEGIAREVGALAREAGSTPFAGFYTYGEIARVQGIEGFHNQTLVVLALG
ncbi:FIST N-terminal domain-containing protein [Kineococcus sp. NUM-3379]